MYKLPNIYIALGLLLCSVQSQAQRNDSVVIPKSVKETFTSIYPGATHVKWQRTSSFADENVKYVYKVKFLLGDYSIGAETDSSGSRFAEFSHQAYIPEGAWKNFKPLLPQAEILDCILVDSTIAEIQAKGYYDVEFTYSADSANYQGYVIMDSSFNVLEVWKDIPHNKLPAAITKQIQQGFTTCTFSQQEGTMMVKEKGEITYFVSLIMQNNEGSYWLFFNDKGQLVKKESHTWRMAGL
ncbi:MAG TPA: hypothetical protein VK783_08075 [Bacteroidia bacterium]|nr:hypothetical protein [Bacteroidia bacterium]